MKYEIWLGNDSTHFDHGIATFDDGHTEPLGAYCNVGIRKDSLLVGVPNGYGEIDDQLRWLILPGVIEFYSRSLEMESIVFHNTSDHDIYIFKQEYLKPGESVEINQDYNHIHARFLRGYSPMGLGRLVETSHTEEEYQEVTGKYGLILTRPSRRNRAKTVILFVLAGVFRNEYLDLEGIETGAGELTYEEGNRIVLQTENSRYVFAYDKGDAVNE